MTGERPLSWKRRFGEIEATILSGGTMPFNVERYMAEDPVAIAETRVDGSGSVLIGTNFLFVSTPDSAVMVDPGGWSDDHVARLPGLKPIRLADVLPVAEIDPAEVTHVLITHGHPDHCLGLLEDDPGGRPRFPNARHHIHRLDYQGVGASEAGYRELRDLLGPVEAAGLLHVVDGGETVVASGVTMLHTGGESAGHSVVRVSRGDNTLFYLGDLFHLHGEMAHVTWAMKGRDAEEIAPARRRVLAEAEASRAVLLMTHDDGVPPWGAVSRSGPDSWAWRYLEPDRASVAVGLDA